MALNPFCDKTLQFVIEVLRCRKGWRHWYWGRKSRCPPPCGRCSPSRGRRRRRDTPGMHRRRRTESWPWTCRYWWCSPCRVARRACGRTGWWPWCRRSRVGFVRRSGRSPGGRSMDGNEYTVDGIRGLWNIMPDDAMKNYREQQILHLYPLELFKMIILCPSINPSRQREHANLVRQLKNPYKSDKNVTTWLICEFS